jgi:acyl carrier protein phosphodiesterase
MNYLAHALLSGNDDNLIVGNFIADHVRGNELHVFSMEIQEGIRLHRQIDTFTDAHPAFRASKRFFYRGFERHSGILVDIYFDHLLARDFDRHSPVSLPQFSDKVFEVYEKHRGVLPGSSARFLDYLVSNRIYESYASEAGIAQVLTHLSHRIRHGIKLQESMALFRENEKKLDELFQDFFADIRRQIRSV